MLFPANLLKLLAITDRTKINKKAASADRTARHHVFPMGVSPFAFRCRRKRSYPCQYIDTTRKAIDCATTLLLKVFILL